jgi:pyrrolidone-carboxylate peptidase
MRTMSGAAPKNSIALTPKPNASQAKCSCGARAPSGEECDECKKKQVLRRATVASLPSGSAPPLVREVLSAPGKPLDDEIRRFLEPRFGADFGRVRLHDDAEAARSASQIGALAYATGQHMVFARGRFQPRTPEGMGLLAHELAHVVQQDPGRIPSNDVAIGSTDDPAERAADRLAAAALSGTEIAKPVRGDPVVRRAPDPGKIGWTGATGPDKDKTTPSGMTRIPLDSLAVGHQTGVGSSGKAIVVLPPGLDLTKPVDVLLHFHGHNAGNVESGGKTQDVDIDAIEDQLSRAGKKQLVGILPQGTGDSEFGTTSATVGKQTKKTKSFDVDGYIDTVFRVLVGTGVWTKAPARSGVMISGHSGAGELIDEKILGSALGSKLPAGASPTDGSKAPSAFKELALIDAINGPAEHARVHEFLEAKMTDEIAAAVAKGSDDDRAAYLAGSFKFRGWYSHAPKIGNYYSQWYVGPVVRSDAVYKESIQALIDKRFDAAKTALGGENTKAFKAFAANYKITDAGTAVHDDMVAEKDHLKDAVDVLPKSEAGNAPDSAKAIPGETLGVLRESGRELDGQALDWAQGVFGRDLRGVRIHDDAQAAGSARALGALAFTAGGDIVFGSGRFDPASNSGRMLLAHELAHVIQQGGPRVRAGDGPLDLGPERGHLEREADDAARSVEERGRAQVPSRTAPHPLVQRTPDDDAKASTPDRALCEANASAAPVAPGTCNYKTPENCPTYEGWMETFASLKTFSAKDTPGAKSSGIDVIGEKAASQSFRPQAVEPGPPPEPKAIGPLKPGERFIDHPTDEWVKKCLPENLRATAYQLPADCADVAMILRHVWLSAHHRTQKFGKWTLGSEAGKAEEKDVLRLISDVGTEQVAGIVAPYSDAQGHPLRSITTLSPLLHAGDILVWWHYDKGFDKPRTGGHTHTITHVDRDESGKLRNLTLVQGNEPLFQEQKDDIHAFLKSENPKKAEPDDKALGSAPGRRVERTTAKDANLEFEDSVPEKDKSPAPIWKWGAETLLVAAGPPRSSARPAATVPKGGKGPALRRLQDWIPGLKAARGRNLVGQFEAMLFEARATVEAGGSLVEEDARSVGKAAGTRIWELGKAAKDLGNESHFQVLQEILEILDAFISSHPSLGPDSTTAYNQSGRNLATQLTWIRDSFEFSARGASDVDFAKGTPAKSNPVRILVTGFDPFETGGSLRKPDPGEWNPSGAAVLALDGLRLPAQGALGSKGVAAVEGVVLPVSFQAFEAGVVEKMVGPHAREVDAVLTISEDAGLDASRPVRLERYAVGVHDAPGGLSGVAAATGGTAGPAIIESNAPVDDIAEKTELPAKKGSTAIDKPTTGETITFKFASAKDADKALSDLGLPAAHSQTAEISDDGALQQILVTMKRRANGTQIDFEAGGETHSAHVVSGPGGNFLSNEVSYRAQRLLRSDPATRDALSFHTHTQHGEPVEKDDGTAAGKKTHKASLDKAMGLRAKIVATMRRIIGVVAGLVLDKRAPKKP